MKRFAFLFLIVLFVMGCETSSTVEDPATTHFVKFYGQDGDQTGRDLVILPDGSMVLFGTSRPTLDTNGSQWLVVRVDAKGNIIWQREYGGQLDEEARDIEYTTAGNLVVVGNSYKASDGKRDVLVMTLNPSDGSKIDSALVPTQDISTFLPTPGDENASTISEIAGGFIVAGTTTYVDPANPDFPTLVDTHDALMLRLNTDLTVYPNIWKQVHGTGGDDGFIKVMAAPPGAHQDYYAFGYSNINETQNTVGYDYWVVFFGSTAVENSPRFYLGTSSAEEKMSSFDFTGSQLLMTGLQVGLSTDVYFGSAFLPQANQLVLQFEKALGLNLGSNLSGHTAVCKAPVNGGFYILAEENGFNNNQNWVLTRFNNDGTPGWSSPIVYGGEGFDSAGAVKELPDGRVVIIGTMRTGRPDAGEYKMTLVKVDGEGKFEK